MNKEQLIINGRQYNEIETRYILDRLENDSRMTVYDTKNNYVDTRVVITRVADDGYVYARVLDGEGRGIGDERQVECGYYISGCEYAELVLI